MTNLIPAHAIAALNNAAKADMQSLDLWFLSQVATEDAHMRVQSTVQRFEGAAQKKIDAAMNLVPDNAVTDALAYLAAKASDFDLERRARAIRGAVSQRKMREYRLAKA